MDESSAPDCPKDGSSEERAARRAIWSAKVQETLAAVEQLQKLTNAAFPTSGNDGDEVLRPALETLSVEARLALGDAVSGQLFQIAMNLAPEATLDCLDKQLGTDRESKERAAAVVAQAQQLRFQP